MTPLQIAPSGGPCDIACHDGQILVAFQDGPGPDARLVVRAYPRDLSGVAWSLSWALGSDVGAFPRLLSAGDSWWLIYREGATLGGRAVLRRDGVEVWRSEAECGGNDPVCAGSLLGLFVADWQRAGDNRIGRVYGDGRAIMTNRVGRPTGLSHMTPDADVVLVDDARGSVHGMTRPCFAGPLVIGEHPTSGALVRHTDGRELRLWVGEDAYVPRLAYDAQTGTYAAVTHGRQGVRLVTFAEADLVAPAPPQTPEWDAMGTPVDAGAFFDIQGSTVPVMAADGQVWQAHRVSDDTLVSVKQATPHLTDVYRLTPDDVRHAYDATDGRYPRAWRLDVLGDGRSDARWCKAITEVGWTHSYVARLIRRTEGGPSTSEPWPYLVGVEKHGRHHDYGGDVGVVDRVLVLRYEPHVGLTADGYHELAHWGIHKGRAIGLLRYEEIRNGAVKASTTFNRYAPSRTVAPSALVILPIPDPLDTPAPPTEPPVPPTEPTITDPEAQNTGERIEHFYAKHADAKVYAKREVYTDALSYVWAIRYYQQRQRGIGHEPAIQAVERAMAVAAGVSGPSEPGEPAPPVPPPSGPLPVITIAAGERAFLADGQPILPVLCHFGDGLSRLARGHDITPELDAIAAAGYDGVRTWTVLHGDYWAGREVGPMHGAAADYWRAVLDYADLLRARGLRWLVSQGDMLRALSAQGMRRDFMDALSARLIDESVFGVDAGNEAWQNGETDPAKLREVVEAFRPGAVWSLTSPADEDKIDLDRYAGSVYDVHGFRDNRAWDKIRHIFSLAYEVRPDRRLGIQSEPFGPGARVSVTANKAELTGGVMALACAVSLMSRQAWVYFSGPGVVSDEVERLASMPGFRDTPMMRAALPADLMTFESLVHGGASQKGRRVFAVPGTDETRADHAIADDGRFVCAVYGPRWKDVTQERDCRIERQIECGEAGYVVVGRLA